MDPSFDERVRQVVAQIPAGQLATYGQIAELIGAYGCARQVGWALRRLSLPSQVPWHRVVNAQGRISMSLSREGSDWIQRELLLAEGIPVDAEGKLPLARYRWLPPGAQFISSVWQKLRPWPTTRPLPIPATTEGNGPVAAAHRVTVNPAASASA